MVHAMSKSEAKQDFPFKEIEKRENTGYTEDLNRLKIYTAVKTTRTLSTFSLYSERK